MGIWLNIQEKQWLTRRLTTEKFTPTPSHTDLWKIAAGKKPIRRQIDEIRRAWARKFLLRAWRLWKIESAGLDIEVPAKGPLPSGVYGKAAERRQRADVQREASRIKRIEREERRKKYAAQMEEFRKRSEIRKARASVILAQQAKTREQLPLYQAVLDSYKTTGFRGYRYSTPEKAAEHRKLYMKAYSAIWRWTKFREKDRRVKDKRPASGPGIGAFYREIATADSVVCHYCCKEIPPALRTVDHYIPLAKGGPHTRDNLVAACWDCNMRKSDKMPEEFLLTIRSAS